MYTWNIVELRTSSKTEWLVLLHFYDPSKQIRPRRTEFSNNAIFNRRLHSDTSKKNRLNGKSQWSGEEKENVRTRLLQDVCSNKINAICSTYRFYERTAGIELGRRGAIGGGEVVRIKEGRKAVNRQVASGKVDRVKGALLSRSLAFGSVLFNEHFLSRSTPRQSRAFTAETLDTAWKARRIALLPFRELKYASRMETTSYADRHSSKRKKRKKKKGEKES